MNRLQADSGGVHGGGNLFLVFFGVLNLGLQLLDYSLGVLQSSERKLELVFDHLGGIRELAGDIPDGVDCFLGFGNQIADFIVLVLSIDNSGIQVLYDSFFLFRSG